MGVAYDKPNVRLIDIFTKKVKGKFFLLYSNPKKKDTDADGLKDNKDPYPWHGYCGGKHPEKTSAHKCSLNEDGYYVCKKCKYKFKSAELEDAKILTDEDKRNIASLVKMFAYYGAKSYRINKTTKLCKNQKLLLNEMRKIRRQKKYKNKYQYSDSAGYSIQEKYEVDGKVYISVTEINGFTMFIYSGAAAETLGYLSSKICPEFAIVWTMAELLGNDEPIEKARVTAEDVSQSILDFLGKKIENKAMRRLYLLNTQLLNVATPIGIIDKMIHSKIKSGDIELTICIDRVKGGSRQGDIRQSWSTFVYRGINPLYSNMGSNYGNGEVAIK